MIEFHVVFLFLQQKKREKKCDGLRLNLDDEVWGPEPETELGGQDLLGLLDSARQRQHQGGLVYQLVLVVVVLQRPLKRLHWRRNTEEQL